MAITTILASMAAWFTPTVLFCATNLIIATIFIASNTKNNHQQQPHEDHSPTPNRVSSSSSSSFLDRARSFKLSPYSTTTAQSQHHFQSKPDQTATYSSSSRLAQSIYQTSTDPPPSLFQRVKSIKFSSSVEDDNTVPENNNSPGQLVRPPSFLDRLKSFTMYASTEPEDDVIRTKLEKKKKPKPAKKKKSSGEMKKSRSEMRIDASTEDDEDVNLRRPETARERRSDEEEVEVDARADDFISRFKQQLKLQRLESLVRYNQMLNRRSSN